MSTARVGLAARPSRSGIGSEKVNAASTPYLAAPGAGGRSSVRSEPISLKRSRRLALVGQIAYGK